jgi:plasmid stabilization system protein ParE
MEKRDAGLDVAKRFRQAIESAYAQLAEMPRMGAPAKVRLCGLLVVPSF